MKFPQPSHLLLLGLLVFTGPVCAQGNPGSLVTVGIAKALGKSGTEMSGGVYRVYYRAPISR